MYEALDQKDPVFDAKGIETVRRDSCPAVSKVKHVVVYIYSCLIAVTALHIGTYSTEQKCTLHDTKRQSLTFK